MKVSQPRNKQEVTMSSLRYVGMLVLALSGLGGCTLMASPAPRAVVVTVAPPRPVVEVRTINPGYGYIWIDGYWGWSGGQWVWSSGRWETERVGYYWVAPRYEQRGGNYYYASGGWQQNKSYKQPNNQSYNNPPNNGYSN